MTSLVQKAAARLRKRLTDMPVLARLRRARHITKIAIDPPAPEPGRDGLAIVLIVRNEERHIAEWAAFHHAAGARHFVVYDNGCTDATIANLCAALPAEALTVLPWNQVFRDAKGGRDIHNQVLAYAHATRNFGGRFRWMTFIDVDEFLIPVKAASLPDALAHLEHRRSISLPWHMFGRSGHMEAPEGGVLRNYTRRAADPMTDAKGVLNFKQIVDPCHVTALKVHEIEINRSRETCNDRGAVFTLEDRTQRAFYSADHIQLNHYYTRSDAELRAKIDRGPNLSTLAADHQRRVWRKVRNIEREEVEDHRAVAYLERVGR